MSYKGYVWPHNPRTFSVSCGRDVVARRAPYGGWVLQDLGEKHRVFSGEGAFAGEDAYEQFRQLAAVFRENTAGILSHPVWGGVRARFVELKLLEEPRRDYVAYSFVFWEEPASDAAALLAVDSASSDTVRSAASNAAETEAVYYTVVSGDTLWAIGQRSGLTVAELLALNSWIRNPNLIYPGDRVRLK